MQVKFQKSRFNLLLPSILDFIQKSEDGEYTLKIEKVKRKRSIDANNYSWMLTDKLSEKLLIAGVKISKEEMHSEMIFRYGQPMLDENEAPVIISVLKGIKVTDFYQYAKEIGSGTVNGKEFSHYKIYRPSHTYNSREFSIFLSGIIEECKEQGIPTETPEEINRILSLMEEKNVHL